MNPYLETIPDCRKSYIPGFGSELEFVPKSKQCRLAETVHRKLIAMASSQWFLLPDEDSGRWHPITDCGPLRPALQGVRQAIEASKTILDLDDDWDDEGSVGYVEATWARAVDYLEKSAERLWDMHGIVLDPPEILPGPDGSIDLHWNQPDYEMLINFPSDEDSPAGFYADDKGNLSIKGKINPSGQNLTHFVWFAEARLPAGASGGTAGNRSIENDP